MVTGEGSTQTVILLVSNEIIYIFVMILLMCETALRELYWTGAPIVRHEKRMSHGQPTLKSDEVIFSKEK